MQVKVVVMELLEGIRKISFESSKTGKTVYAAQASFIVSPLGKNGKPKSKTGQASALVSWLGQDEPAPESHSAFKVGQILDATFVPSITNPKEGYLRFNVIGGNTLWKVSDFS